MNSISESSLQTTMARKMGLFLSSPLIAHSASFLPYKYQVIFQFLVSISTPMVSPSLILAPPFLLSPLSQILPVFSQYPMNSLWSWARLTPRIAAVPIPYMKDPLLPARICFRVQLQTSFRSISCLQINTSQLLPQFFLYRLPTLPNFPLCGLVQSARNRRLPWTGLDHLPSFSFYSRHLLSSPNQEKILFSTSSFCASARCRAVTSSLRAAITPICPSDRAAKSICSCFRVSTLFSKFFNLRSTISPWSSYRLTVGILNSMLLTCLPMGMSMTKMRVPSRRMVSSFAEVQRNLKRSRGASKKKLKFLSSLMRSVVMVASQVSMLSSLWTSSKTASSFSWKCSYHAYFLPRNSTASAIMMCRQVQADIYHTLPTRRSSYLHRYNSRLWVIITCFCFYLIPQDFFSYPRRRQQSFQQRFYYIFIRFMIDLEADKRSLHQLIDLWVFQSECRTAYISFFRRRTYFDFQTIIELSVAMLFLVWYVVEGVAKGGATFLLRVFPNFPFCLLTILPARLLELALCMVFSLPSERIFFFLKNSAVELWSNLGAYLIVRSCAVSMVMGMICVSRSDSFICRDWSYLETLCGRSSTSIETQECCLSEREKASESAFLVADEELLLLRGKRLRGLCMNVTNINNMRVGQNNLTKGSFR